MRRLLPWLVLVGCAEGEVPEEIEGVRVSEAWIEEVRLGAFGMVGGYVGGSGQLFVRSPDQRTEVLPVTLEASMAGLALDMSAVPGGRLDLQLPAGGVVADQLFGRYRGSREALVLLAGPVGLHLENEHGVRIDETLLGLGISIFVGTQWLVIREKEPAEAPETGIFLDDSGTWTIGSGDTGAPFATGHTGAATGTGGASPGGSGATGDTAGR